MNDSKEPSQPAISTIIPTPPNFGPSERRGRTFLLSALALIAVFFLEGMAAAFTKGTNDLAESVFAIGLAAWVLILAFRGGERSLKLIKGCAVLMLLPILLLAGFLSWKVAQTGIPGSVTLENTAPFLVQAAAVLFIVWALFLSTDVRSFLTCQHAVAYAKAREKIVRKAAASSRSK